MKTILSHTGEKMRFLLALLTLLPLAGAADHAALRNPNDRFWRKHSPAQYRVRVETTRGAFVLEVHRDWAPIGADRFYNLVRAGFYDDSRFYRVTTRFAQFGIAGSPAIAAVWRHPTLLDDPVPRIQHARTLCVRHDRSECTHHADLHLQNRYVEPG